MSDATRMGAVSKCTLALVMSLSPLTDSVTAMAKNPAVVPSVQRWTEGDGVLGLSDVAAYVDEHDFLRAAELLAMDWEEMGFGALSVHEGKAPENGSFILFERGPVPAAADGMVAREAYRLEIGQRGAVIRAETSTGAFYATRALLQMLSPSDREDPAIPRGEIIDGPMCRGRMLMLDVGRKPFPVAVLKDYIRMMAWLRMNELHLHLSDHAFGGCYTGFRVESETFPGLASKDFHYTKRDIRDLQDFAKERGVTITPEIDMPGHARVFTDYWPDLRLPGGEGGYMDVTNPETITRMKALLDEMIPLFDAPDFHIGTDEYRVRGSESTSIEVLHEAFRAFINTMNEHVRSHGKNTRIWSGFEHMKGTTEIDASVTIDMWVTDDASAQIRKGHHVINSNHGRTYIVPGARYYGVSNRGIYDNWWPWQVSPDVEKNPDRSSPQFLGAKLHVWNDKGPTGYTMTETALLTWPSLMSFAEKMWGTKGSPDYATFSTRSAGVRDVPGVRVFDRLLADEDGLVLDRPEETVFSDESFHIELPFASTGRVDLEWPWTLTFDIRRDRDVDGREIVFSSSLAEVFIDYAFEAEEKKKDENGKKVTTLVPRRGIGMVRASGCPGDTPADARLAKETRSIYAPAPPLEEWVTLKFVGTEKRVRLYVNGELAGERGEQMACPLGRLGATAGGSFVGAIRNLKVYDRVVLP